MQTADTAADDAEQALYYRAPTEGQLSTDPASPGPCNAEPAWTAYDYLVVSGDYLAFVVVHPVNPGARPHNQAIESYVRQTLGSLDPYLSTSFGG